MDEMKKLKVYQLCIEQSFNGQEPNLEERYVKEHFSNDEEEINDFFVWRKEDKEYFLKKLTNLIEKIKKSKVEDIME